ncbi:Plant disease resistance response protein [Cinnamomum micranthum f. kanehirae]|uniref:Dirigent protein n=1 Tax=Cinnamomum micranthum f. kanehirae TaxID=337451 RepID=A0A3S4P5M2_9MAGN|nr:Plant disease resistance response protein [Cinnamomum micranthum f. kanehirae]
MGKQLLVVVFFFMSMIAFTGAESKPWKTRPVDDWRDSLVPGKEKVSHLHFYFHDTPKGRSQSSVQVAQAPVTNQSATFFGAVMMADDPLTEGPEPTSKLLGRAQGMYGSAGQKELTLLMVMAYSFTSGKYKGSSFSIMGNNPVMHPVREMPIVGGTGIFRFARGVAMAKTYIFNTTTGVAIVEYDAKILHF